jgi:hypothetical protein
MIRKIEDFKGFKGYVSIDFGKYRQRINELSSLSIDLGKDGTVELTSTNSLKEIMKIYDLIHTKVKEVALTHIESNRVFTSLDELEDYQEYGDVMAKLIEAFNKGEMLGN